MYILIIAYRASLHTPQKRMLHVGLTTRALIASTFATPKAEARRSSMIDKPDGGPVFPKPSSVYGPNGMYLRDWFAGMALPSVVAALDKHRNDLPTELVPDVAAETAYLFADAMLIARDK